MPFFKISLIYFNPHSRKGSDGAVSKGSYGLCYFNPHSRKGSDMMGKSREAIEKISIHTPARGVTKSACLLHSALHISIHTPARGVTLCLDRRLPCLGISIHTPARGVTIAQNIWSSAWEDFNPHSRKGSDEMFSAGIAESVFQSTLPQGE